ncbi:STAS-like domain-containing protein [Deinococcus sp. Leaf326]|uniref:STAS-like domain-containing protein n=1 Tax=Deinococcus sp. Leaf326 TaxID=1736338 RepID=UPI0009E96B6E|nr:STAS-like domain-containing protein [Deinococcus sp. Leaf326]
MSKIVISKQFSKYPGGRYFEDGDYNGQKFREEYLVKALQEESSVEVELDGTRGYDSSFLEEAFGGLIRDSGFALPDLDKRLILKSEDRFLLSEIRGYMMDAWQKIQG